LLFLQGLIAFDVVSQLVEFQFGKSPPDQQNKPQNSNYAKDDQKDFDVYFFGLPESDILINGVYTFVITQDWSWLKAHCFEVLQVALCCDLEQQEVIADQGVVVALARNFWGNDLVLAQEQVVLVGTEESAALEYEFLEKLVLIHSYLSFLRYYLQHVSACQHHRPS